MADRCDDIMHAESNMIGGGYLGANNSSATSSTSPSALSNLNKTVTVTITTTGSGVGTGSGGASITPSSVLTDLAGNSARSTARTMSPLF